MWSASPCHHRIGTVTSRTENPQGRQKSKKSKSGAASALRLPRNRSSRNIALISGREKTRRSPSGETRAYASNAGDATGLMARTPKPRTVESGRCVAATSGARGSEPADQPARDGVLSLCWGDPTEHTADHDALGKGVGARQHIGATARETEHGEAVHTQPIQKSGEVGHEVEERPVQKRRRLSNARAVDPDDSDLELLGRQPCGLRDLAPRPGRAMHPDDRTPLRRAELAEGESAAGPNFHRSFQMGFDEVAHLGQPGSTVTRLQITDALHRSPDRVDLMTVLATV